MDNKYDIAKDWLPRYTGMPVDKCGDSILLTNFQDYVEEFAGQFSCDIEGQNRPMSSYTNAVTYTHLTQPTPPYV